MNRTTNIALWTLLTLVILTAGLVHEKYEICQECTPESTPSTLRNDEKYLEHKSKSMGGLDVTDYGIYTERGYPLPILRTYDPAHYYQAIEEIYLPGVIVNSVFAACLSGIIVFGVNRFSSSTDKRRNAN